MFHIFKINTLLFLILIIIPLSLLIVDPYVLFPFITTKALIFRSLVSIALVLGVIIVAKTDKVINYKNPLFISVTLFFIANILATFLGIDYFRSFWGNAERMEGLWSMFFYYLYFLLLTICFNINPSYKKYYFFLFIAVSVIISLYQINEFVNSFLQSGNIDVRPYSSLGNATYVGFFTLLMLFAIFIFLFDEKDSANRLIFSLAALINFFAMIASQTRGSLLGLLSGSIAFFIFYILFSEKTLQKRIFLFSALIASLLLFVAFLRLDIAFKIPGVQRLATTLQNPESVFPRLYAWRMFLEAFKEKPVFGWGLENEPVAFLAYLNPYIFNFERAIFDRPHNKFIEVLVKSGVVGFVTWLSIFISAFYLLFLKRKENLLVASAAVGFLVAYLGQVFSLFDMQASYLLFFFVLATLMPRTKFTVTEKSPQLINFFIVLSVIIAFIFLTIHIRQYYVLYSLINFIVSEEEVYKALTNLNFSLTPQSVNDLNVNALINALASSTEITDQSLKPANLLKLADPVAKYDKTVELLKKHFNYASERLKNLSEIAGPFLTEVVINTYRFFAEPLVTFVHYNLDTNYILKYNKIIEKAYFNDPRDFRLALNYINHLSLLIKLKQEARLSIDEEKQKMLNLYKYLQNLYPNLPEVYLNFANKFYEIPDNRFKELSGELLEKGEKAIADKFNNYLLDETAIFLYQGNYAKALAKLNLFLEKNKNIPLDQFSIDKQFLFLNVYLANKDVEKANFLIKNILNEASKTQNQQISEQIKLKISELIKFYQLSEIIKLDK